MNELFIDNNNYTRKKFNNHIQLINYTRPSNKYKLIEVITPVTSLFLKNINDFVYNNTLNEEHINCIYNNLLKDEDKNIIGNFTVVQCDEEDNKLYLLDGHHRKEALKKIMYNNQDIVYIDNILIEIKLYHVNKINSDLTFELYEKINNVKPYQIKLKEDYVREIMSKLEEYEPFNKCLKMYQDNTRIGNFPNYNKNIFINKLNISLLSMSNIDTNKIVCKLIEFNESCCKLDIYKLFNVNKQNLNINKDITIKYNKVKKCNFYLRTPFGENWDTILIIN
jgi:hypothetical protein